MKIKTSELIGAALDWAVGEVHGEWAEEPYHLRDSDGLIWCNNHSYGYSPSTDWEQGGPLIHAYAMGFVGYDADNWLAFYCPENITHEGIGPTHLISACRAIVADKLGETVDIPEDLLK